jgi:hypothetical protein
MKSMLPQSIRKGKSPEKISTQFETRSNAGSVLGVNKFDPRDYVTHSKTIKTLASLKKVTNNLLKAQSTSRKLLKKSKIIASKTKLKHNR